ncbi:NAD(P)-dependent dehydrogenase (short-subunit alcohol dehydrogenase family) [Sphingobium jiangsuense]|uniref:NAD(P)-dependent dehydrogenase (Short-subunit alcohol dehydrogenase family) n=1 Tax=Sphingobium jiangsuense TaxID=870476 RepID=A0A7W6FQH4_9SPHN|nr:SDR family oxidoreductase [Sphingobium jiangsuense]MBB3926940.1 NAD(P)-dependent dehydrogenase (short-subunit alcohol dehydrogenase family) [Sphingobium jiangsuense]
MSGGQFDGKVALVTGGGSGIGRAACQRLAMEGARVVVADIDAAGAERTAGLVAQAGGEAVAVRADIAREDDNRAMFDLAEQRFGGLDAAFLNAGILQPYGPLETVTTEMFDRLIAVNLRGTFLGVQQARARLRPGGACVVTASAAGIIGFAEAAAYAVSKHGLVGLVRSAAAAFAARGARINAICPGMVLTAMTGNAGIETIDDPDRLDDPAYRGALTAQQIAEVALFLLSRRAAGLNGQVQAVDAALLSAFPPIDGLG